ncbi:FmdB family zinc ribbon protein [Nonomuraea typhae]|uniref:FmdB family zinc ribbon protein n=1 Tax=Nonomuraea typhae TaxID=2603600 RepID=A0ABW7Z7P7_9ACTN|nr:FmdB family zinc ribbon protein [Nonomuraea typhae]
MTTYEYTCLTCGPFEERHPMGQAPGETPCRCCGTPAPRRFSPPAVRQITPKLRRALDAQESSAHEPRVVRR